MTKMTTKRFKKKVNTYKLIFRKNTQISNTIDKNAKKNTTKKPNYQTNNDNILVKTEWYKTYIFEKNCKNQTKKILQRFASKKAEKTKK